MNFKVEYGLKGVKLVEVTAESVAIGNLPVDPVPNVPKRLYIVPVYDDEGKRNKLALEVQLHEYAGQIFAPLQGTITVNLLSGLTNQLYMLASAAIIGHHMNRPVDVRSLRFVSRKDPMDHGWSVHAADKLRVPLSHLFDVGQAQTLFPNPVHIPILDDAIAKFATVKDLQKQASSVFNCAVIDQARLPSSSITSDKRFHWPVCSTVELQSPYLAIVPESLRDFQILRQTFDAFVPAPRLATIVTQLLTAVDSNVFTALHYRCEIDWPDSVRHNLQDALQQLLQEVYKHSVTCRDVPLYIAGKIPADYLSQIRTVCTAASVRCVYKEDVLPTVTTEYGFEELAVIDRAMCLASTYFYGSAHSTFSLSIAIQRRHKHSKFYTKEQGSRTPVHGFCANGTTFLYSDV